VLVLCQVQKDRVLQHARVSSEEMLRAVADATRGTSYEVVVKRHPRCKSEAFHEQLRETVDAYPHAHLLDGPIHQLIANAAGVAVINSGSGFEALIHQKPVFTFGRADYEHATYPIRSHAEARAIPELLVRPLDLMRIKRFVWYYLTHYTVDVTAPSFGPVLQHRLRNFGGDAYYVNPTL